MSLRRATGSLHGVPSALWMDLLATIGIGISSAMVITLLPTIGRRNGLEPLGLAALAGTPFIANVFGIMAGRLGPRTARQFGAMRVASTLPLVALPFLALPSAVIGAAVSYWLGLAMTAPFQFQLWGSTYPARLHDRVVGLFGAARAAAAAGAALLAGIAADVLGGPPAVAIAGAIAASLALIFAVARRWEESPWPTYGARQSISAIRTSPTIKRLALAQALYGGGFISAAPLMVLVYVDRLDLSLTEVGFIGVLGAVATSITSAFWGLVAQRFGAHLPIRLGSILGAIGLLLYASAPTYIVVCLAALFVGATLAAIEIGVFAIIARETRVEGRAATIGGWNALMGARGLIAPFVASAAVQAGAIDVTGGLLACSVACSIGIVAFWRSSDQRPAFCPGT